MTSGSRSFQQYNMKQNGCRDYAPALNLRDILGDVTWFDEERRVRDLDCAWLGAAP